MEPMWPYLGISALSNLWHVSQNIVNTVSEGSSIPRSGLLPSTVVRQPTAKQNMHLATENSSCSYFLRYVKSYDDYIRTQSLLCVFISQTEHHVHRIKTCWFRIRWIIDVIGTFRNKVLLISDTPMKIKCKNFKSHYDNRTIHEKER
jgi:hypothetical protein